MCIPQLVYHDKAVVNINWHDGDDDDDDDDPDNNDSDIEMKKKTDNHMDPKVDNIFSK